MDGLESELGKELGLGGEKKSLDLPLAPAGIGFGVEEFDAEIGADDLEVLAAEGGAIVGVEFGRQSAGGDGALEGVEEAFEPFGLVELAMDTKPGVIVEECKEVGAQGRAATATRPWAVLETR